MAEFGIQATQIAPTPNAVTPKTPPVNHSKAIAVGAAGTAAVEGSELHAIDILTDAQKDMTTTLRQDIGLDGETEPATPEEKSFGEYVKTLQQVAKLGNVAKANLKLEEELRRRTAQHPHLADRYRRIAGTLKSDYATTLSLLADMEQKMAAAGSEADKRRYGEVKKIRELAAAGGPELPSDPNDWSDEMRYQYFVDASHKASIKAAEERSMALKRFEWAGNAEERAARGEGRAITAEQRKQQKFNIEMQDEADREAIASIASRAFYQASNAVNDIMRSNATLEQKQVFLRDALHQYRTMYQGRLYKREDGSPTGFKDELVAQSVENFNQFLDSTAEYFTGDLATFQILNREWSNLWNMTRGDVFRAAPILMQMKAGGLLPNSVVSDAVTNTALGDETRSAIRSQVQSIMSPQQQIEAEPILTSPADAPDKKTTVNDLLAMFRGITGQADKLPPNLQPKAAAGSLAYLQQSRIPGTSPAQELDSNPKLYGWNLKTLGSNLKWVSRTDRDAIASVVLAEDFFTKYSRMAPEDQNEYAPYALNILRSAMADNLVTLPGTQDKKFENGVFKGTGPQDRVAAEMNHYLARFIMLDKARGGAGNPEEIIKREFVPMFREQYEELPPTSPSVSESTP